MGKNKFNNTFLIYVSSVTFVNKVYFCYGEEEYTKFSSKRYKAVNETIERSGVTTLWNTSEVCIGVKKLDNELVLRGLIVHELSHAVDYIMRENHLTDNEYKAYTMQSMYQSVMSFMEDIFKNKGECGVTEG